MEKSLHVCLLTRWALADEWRIIAVTGRHKPFPVKVISKNTSFFSGQIRLIAVPPVEEVRLELSRRVPPPPDNTALSPTAQVDPRWAKAKVFLRGRHCLDKEVVDSAMEEDVRDGLLRCVAANLGEFSAQVGAVLRSFGHRPRLHVWREHHAPPFMVVPLPNGFALSFADCQGKKITEEKFENRNFHELAGVNHGHGMPNGVRSTFKGTKNAKKWNCYSKKPRIAPCLLFTSISLLHRQDTKALIFSFTLIKHHSPCRSSILHCTTPLFLFNRFPANVPTREHDSFSYSSRFHGKNDVILQMYCLKHSP